MDNLLQKRWSRNATLVQGLATLDIIEELGFGLQRMVAAMAEDGLPAPVFADNGDTFVVTLYGHGRDLLAGTETRRPTAEPTVEATGGRTSAERQAWALDHLRTAGPLTARDYAEALGVSPATALRDLRDLVRRGVVDASGTTNDRRYRLRVGRDD